MNHTIVNETIAHFMGKKITTDHKIKTKPNPRGVENSMENFPLSREDETHEVAPWKSFWDSEILLTN